MLFNSLAFLFFFILAFGLYWAIPSKRLVVRNAFLLIASYFFYGFWDWRFLGLIALSTLVDFLAGQQIHRAKKKSVKKLWLSLSLFINLGALGLFKYFNFFADGFAELLHSFGLEASYSTINVVLPVGISFYTFQTLSYTIDIYREKIKPTSNLLQFAVFVAFFPQLVAGPIERAASLLPQFKRAKTFKYQAAVFGLMLMIYGFFKKVAIADNIGALIDPVFNSPADFHNWQVLFAIVGFTIQIYTDFSGYSDIAIGLAAMFGFKLNTNFKTPLFSYSIQEFWQRWHISLSTWFRDYVYLPSGGNRNGKFKWGRNILLTFGLSGLWHGAGLTFIFFGLFHGIYYLLEASLKFSGKRMINWLITFLAVLFGFLLFRATSLGDVSILLKNLFSFETLPQLAFGNSTWIMAFSLLMFYVFERLIRNTENFAVWLTTKKKPFQVLALYVLVFWTILFGWFESSQNFIYFQF